MKLFSVKKKFADRIFDEKKKLEFRRQNVHIKPGEKCLIYVSSPVKSVEGYFIVSEKIRLPLSQLWVKTKDLAGVTYEEFREYFDGCKEGTALLFNVVRRLKQSYSLDDLRKSDGSFRPPQSYARITYELERLILGNHAQLKLPG